MLTNVEDWLKIMGMSVAWTDASKIWPIIEKYGDSRTVAIYKFKDIDKRLLSQLPV